MIILSLESLQVLLLPLLSPWLAAEGTLRAQIPISLLIAENTTRVSCFSPFHDAYLCLIILLVVGKMPEYLQNLDDGSVLLFRLCLENANIISEVRNIWSNEYFLNY